MTQAQVDKAVAGVEKLAQQVIDDNTVPGLAIAVVYQDQLVYAKGFGVRHVGKPETIDADTVFQLASISKPVGSTVVAALVGEGKITWDSKIAALDPAFQLHDPWITREITIRDFYAHRSGLPAHAGDLLEDLGYDRARILYRLRFQKLQDTFRTRETYTNFGVTEAAIAAAHAYALEWEDASDQILYNPLGMRSTSSRYRDFMARPNKAMGHMLVEGKWMHKVQRDPDAQSPAGGVSSSVNDMAKWMRLQIANGKFEGKQLIAKDAIAESHQPQLLRGFSPLSGLPGFGGLGWDLNYDTQGRLRLGHSGAFALGAGTHVALVPGEALSIITLTNGSPTGTAEGLNQIFMDIALTGAPTQDWLGIFKKAFSDPAAVGVTTGADYSTPPAAPTSPLKNDAYLGTFTNDFFGDIAIVEKDGGLAIVEGPNKMSFPLTHYDRDLFTYATTGENAVGTTGVYFRIGADGKASGVRVENLDVDGNGVFRRVHDENKE